ncbi:MAG: KOW domain-containing RNA-binding protein [Saccharofermentanales bacterium]
MITVFELLKNSGIMPGSIVISTAGHDKGRIYLVISVEDKIAYLCDGIYRGSANPKKKRVSHLKLAGSIRDAQRKMAGMAEDAKEEFKDQLIQGWIMEFLDEYDKQGKEK